MHIDLYQGEGGGGWAGWRELGAHQWLFVAGVSEVDRKLKVQYDMMVSFLK